MGQQAKSGNKNSQLIPGLPDEIAMECLVRVPYIFHSNMKSVCHTWQDLLSNQSFYQQRQKSGLAEQFVCLVQPLPTIESTELLTSNTNNTKIVQEDKQEVKQEQVHRPPQYALSIYNFTHNIWHRTRPKEGIPLFSQILSLPSSGKVILLGGWDQNTFEPVPHVYILEFIGKTGCRWKQGAPMLVARSFFACAVVGHSEIYVAGGHDSQKNALKSAEVYDVEKDEWKLLPDMIEERDECQGMAWEGDSKFWVVSGYGTESQGQFKSDAECYDPETGSWSKFDGVWPFSSTSPRGATTTVSVNSSTGSANSKQNQWWWFLGGEQQQQQSGEIKENESKKWEIVNSIQLPNCIIGTTPCVTTLGNFAQLNGHHKDEHKVFMMSGGGSRSTSSFACDECDGEAFILERCSRNGRTKWNHVHTPVGFSGFPYSATNLAI